MNHAELQSAANQLAPMLGWHHLHVRKSIGKRGPRGWQTTTNISGWPDWLLWSPRQPGRHIAVEFKVPPDKLKPEQIKVRDDLLASGFEFYVITPDDLDMLATILARRDKASYGQPTK